MVCLDTSFLIDFLRGRKHAVKYLSDGMNGMDIFICNGPVRDGNHFIATRHGQRAAWKKVVLDVDDDQRRHDRLARMSTSQRIWEPSLARLRSIRAPNS